MQTTPKAGRYYSRLMTTALKNSLERVGLKWSVTAYGAIGFVIAGGLYLKYFGYSDFSHWALCLCLVFLGTVGAWGIAMFVCIVAAPFQIQVEDYAVFSKDHESLLQQVAALSGDRDRLQSKSNDQDRKSKGRELLSSINVNAARLYHDRPTAESIDDWIRRFEQWSDTAYRQINTEISHEFALRLQTLPSKNHADLEAQRRHFNGPHFECLCILSDSMETIKELIRDLT